LAVEASEPGCELRLEACPEGALARTPAGGHLLVVPLRALTAAAAVVARDPAGNETRARLPLLAVRSGETPDVAALPPGACLAFLPGVHPLVRLVARRPLTLMASEPGAEVELRSAGDAPILTVELPPAASGAE